MAVTFDDDVKKIFAPYRACMLRITITTPDGAFALDLGDYDSVKTLNEHITVAIHGYEEDRLSAHPMPPGGTALPDEDIKTWDDWVAGGMIKSKPLAV